MNLDGDSDPTLPMCHLQWGEVGNEDPCSLLSPEGSGRKGNVLLTPSLFLLTSYLSSGVRLGWLFNPQDQQVEIYRLGQEKEVRSLPTRLSGETVLPGFELQVERFTDE